MARLLVLQGEGLPAEFHLDPFDSLIGRHVNAQIRLEDIGVSRRHARISHEGGGYWFEDLGSSNGSFLNGTKLDRKALLKGGDQIRIGRFVFSFEETAALDNPVTIRTRTAAEASNLDLFRENAAEKLRTVLEVSHHLASALELEELFGKLLDLLLGLFRQADRVFIVLIERGEPSVRASRSRSGSGSGTVEFSRSLVRRVAEEAIGVIGEDAQTDHLFAAAQTLHSIGIRSLICVPLKIRDKVVGVLQADRLGSGQPFGPEDLNLLTAVALQVSSALENAQLHQELIEKERIQRDLALAREIQESFLPDPITVLHPDLEMFGRVYPAFEVSGDFYDFFLRDKSTLVLTVADVSGKGMPAALFMTMVRALFRHLAASASGPAELLDGLNRALSMDNPKMMFVTMVCAFYDPATGELRMASGGHPPPILRCSEGSARPAELPQGCLLGFDPHLPPGRECRARLEPGETVLFYTDGVTEACKEAEPDRMFGLDSFVALLAKAPSEAPLVQWAEEIRNSVHEFCCGRAPEDDITLLMLRRTAGGTETSQAATRPPVNADAV